MGNVVYFDISSDFGFFKKPDINKISLTYNLPPKPMILGLIGSILGMNGLNRQYEETRMLEKILDIGDAISKDDHVKVQRLIKKVDYGLTKEGLDILDFKNSTQLMELLQKSSNSKDFKKLLEIITDLKSSLKYPEYYTKLEHLKIGIMPLGNFPFNKIVNVYNSRNSYFRNDNLDYLNQIIYEQLLIKPKYRIFIYDNDEKILNELFSRLSNNNPIFMPYFGKNEFIVSFDNTTIINDIKPLESIPLSKISSIFLNNNNAQSMDSDSKSDLRGGSRIVTGLPEGFVFFEQYPIGYLDDDGLQYNLQEIELVARDVDNSRINMKTGILLEINQDTIYLI